jgi:hypothetical protein
MPPSVRPSSLVGQAMLLLLLTAAAPASILVVTNTNDSGGGSLRDAITAANGSPGADTIQFAIAGSGVHTITLTTGLLPPITDSLTIDGYTQPGSSANTLAVGDNAVILVELDGNGISGGGLIFNATAPNSLVRGLAIKRFGGSSLIQLIGDNGTVQGNFLGTDASGTAAGPGSSEGVYIQGANTLVGGTAPAHRNVIAGNSGNVVLQPAATGVPSVTIQGNYLGTDASGTVALASNYGVVAITGVGKTIGSVTIGGTAAGAGNLISGNAIDGIIIDLGATGAAIGAVTIQGNLLGLDVTGAAPLPNQGDAVSLIGNPTGAFGTILIGGTTVAARNVISSTTGSSSGIRLNGTPASTFVQGNFIGTDVTGTLARPNQQQGVHLVNGAATIGGAAPGAGNLISSNLGGGIYVSDSIATIQANFIGTKADGVTALLNGDPAVNISQSSAATQVVLGGTAAGAGNRILFGEFQAGVVVRGATARATIRGNSIAMAGTRGFPISISSTYPNPNDACDSDTGANRLQNYPVITSAALGGGSVAISGTLNSAASTTFDVDFFSSPVCNTPPGYGPGRTYLGSTQVTTNGSCDGTFGVALPASGAETTITATATDPAGNTSEFSACFTASSSAANFFTVAPCRVADTRGAVGAYGGPALAANVDRTFVIGGQCGIPSGATAVSFNFTITQPTAAGDLRVFPAGGGLPLVSTLNWSPAQTRANNAIVALGAAKDITVHPDQATGTVQLIVDVNGYFQ